MRFYLRSKNFKILISVLAAILVIALVVSAISSVSSPISSFIGTVTTPVQKFFTSVSDKIDGFSAKLDEKEDLISEIERLKEENASLREQLVKHEDVANQNLFYEQYLGIKEKNPEMLFQSATVSARDFTDPYKSFTINVGLIDGVALNDPVITTDGLVGFISEVAPTYSKVTTVLSAKLRAGGKDSRTLDEGIVSGRADLADKGCCQFYNLQRDCSVSINDFVVTSGGSIFPEGLIVGTVKDIKQQTKDTSLYAIVQSNIDFDSIKDVMVITYFSGQGFVGPKGEEQ